MQLALRSGYYKRLNVMAVKQGELVSWNPLTEEITLNLIDDDLARENAPSIGYVASFEYLNGFTKTIYWSREKMEAHALRYATVCLQQPLPLETLSETALNVIIGTLLCKVLENALEHNDGGIWGISNGGTHAGASEDVPESDTL